VELNVRLVAGSSPLRGSMRLTGGETREFWGWLELAELIQQASDGGSDEGRAELRSAGKAGTP
jgi:hypothetical protein